MFHNVRLKLGGENNYKIEKTQRKTIPEHLHFNRGRNMPIASIFGKRGFFVFSSEQSYDKFKQTNFNISKLNAEGVGVPLFHIIQNYNVIGHITGSSPDFQIYRYVLQRVQEPPLYYECKVICEDKDFRLCRLPYCQIYSSLGFLETKYDFFYPSKAQPFKKYQMVRQSNFRDLEVLLDDMRFRWHVDFFSDHYRLMYLDEDSPSLLNDDQTEKQKQSQKRTACPDFVIGHYTNIFSNFLPRSISKCSTLIIGEQSRPDAFGVGSVPELTEMFACQGALLHYLVYLDKS